VRDRVALTERLIADHAHTTIRVATVGRTGVERVMSLVLLGDLVSLYLAVLRGVDPTPVRVLETLKARLAER
jgi:glucose/mannose-6-phosphate isomerase